VKEGDIIKIRKNQIDYQLKIVQIPKSRIGAKLVPLHIEDKTEKEQYEMMKLRQLSQEHYRNKGEGRPTKKDRRDIDGFVVADGNSEMGNGDWDLFFSDVDASDKD
jgi:ribosome-associated heat shock protein Hsp15